ncbi:MAG: hypothetical protein WKF47_04140, partial [Geodermatophilaceae bacterium]
LVQVLPADRGRSRPGHRGSSTGRSPWSWLTIFTLVAPSWQFIVGGLIAVVGSFILFTEKRDVLEVIRAVPSETSHERSSENPSSRVR